VLFNDVPGVAWSYPQAMARSGIKYLVCGMNMFIGGGFTQPYPSYLFRWQSSDGSSVLAWSTQNAYIEGWNTYGIPFGSSGSVNKSKLTSALKAMTDAGYPYDAILVDHSTDAGISQAEYAAAASWNATYQNPQIIPATARDFFEYMEDKYTTQIPVKTGNWTPIWDTCQMMEPQSEKIVRNSQDLVPAAEKLWAIASELGRGTYPATSFDNAWDMQLTENEHAGAGGCWDYYWTQAQVDAANQQYWDYASSCLSDTSATLATGTAAFLGATQHPDRDTIAVFNPLSWTRTDLVRVKVPPALLAADFTLSDAATSTVVPCQKDASTAEVLFVAADVPSLGFKRFKIAYSPQPTPSTSLVAGSNWIENQSFRVEIDAAGHVSGILDKRNSRQLVNAASTYDFGRAIKGTNTEYFYGINQTVTDAVSPSIATRLNGPVAASIRVTNTSHPLAASEIVLYDALDHIDLVNTPDRRFMDYAPHSVNTMLYGFTFPFSLSNYTPRIDTAAGWLNPVTDSIAGSFASQHADQHGVDLSEANYGITLCTPDVMVHAFGGFQCWTYPPAEPTVVSTFIRYVDETLLRGGAMGYVIVEPGSSPQWDLRYALRPHLRGFDSVADARFGWEVCTPLIAQYLPAGPGGIFGSDSRALFTVSAPNVVITDIKKADYGSGMIVKLKEIAGTSASATFASWHFGIAGAWLTTPLEENLAPASVTAGQTISLSMAPGELVTLRLNVVPPSSVPDWFLY
jgi:alpha-mannosidase